MKCLRRCGDVCGWLDTFKEGSDPYAKEILRSDWVELGQKKNMSERPYAMALRVVMDVLPLITFHK